MVAGLRAAPDQRVHGVGDEHLSHGLLPHLHQGVLQPPAPRHRLAVRPPRRALDHLPRGPLAAHSNTVSSQPRRQRPRRARRGAGRGRERERTLLQPQEQPTVDRVAEYHTTLGTLAAMQDVKSSREIRNIFIAFSDLQY